MKGNTKSIMKKISPYIPGILIGLIILIAISGPFIIAWLTYSPTFFTGIPGESSTWLGF